MTKKRIQLRNIQNVAASKTALIDCPIGPRYHYIVMQHGFAAGTNTIAGAMSNILEIRVKVNGRVQRVFSGTQLRDLNLLNGTGYDSTGLPNTAPGVSVPLFMAEPWRDDEVDQDALAWKSNLWESFQIEVDFSSASTPTLVAYAVTDTMTATKPEGIVKVIRNNTGAQGTQFDLLGLDRKEYIQQISLYPDSGGSNATTLVTFRLNGEVIHELSNTANTALLTQFRMTPAASGRTANVYDLVFDHDGLLSSAVNLDGAKDVSVTVTAGSAMSGTLVSLIQRFGLPD